MKKCLLVTIAILLISSTEQLDPVESIDLYEKKIIVHAVLHLTKVCLPEPKNLVAVLTSETVGTPILKDLSETTAVAVVDYSNHEKPNSITKILIDMPTVEFGEDHQIRWGANVFIVLANSSSSLKNLLHYSKNLTWWNSMATFVAVEKRLNCRDVYPFLWTMWDAHLLSSYFFCLDELNITTLYTFNPYDDFAPPPWRKTVSYKGRAGHPWTLFKRRYASDGRSCNNILFEKTGNLNGYQIRTVGCAYEPLAYINESKTGPEQFTGMDSSLLNILFTAWNVTINSTNFGRSACHLGYAFRNGSYQGILGDIFTGRVDIGINVRYMRAHIGLSATYPHGMQQVCFATKILNNEPLLKASTLLTSKMTFLLLGLFLLVAMVLKYLENRSFSWALQNALKMILYGSLDRPPRKTSSKLVIYTEFFVMMILHSIFGGQLVSLLMKPALPGKLDTVKDLEESGYAIYGLPYIKVHLDSSALVDRFHAFNNVDECLENATEKAGKQVCVTDCLYEKTWSLRDSSLHVATEPIVQFSGIYFTVADWPLLQKADRDIQKITEAGLKSYWTSMTWLMMGRHAFDQSTTSQLKSLTRQNLNLVFNVLFFGLLLSLTVFVFEITSPAVYRKWRKMKS